MGAGGPSPSCDSPPPLLRRAPPTGKSPFRLFLNPLPMRAFGGARRNKGGGESQLGAGPPAPARPRTKMKS